MPRPLFEHPFRALERVLQAPETPAEARVLAPDADPSEVVADMAALREIASAWADRPPHYEKADEVVVSALALSHWRALVREAGPVEYVVPGVVAYESPYEGWRPSRETRMERLGAHHLHRRIRPKALLIAAAEALYDVVAGHGALGRCEAQAPWSTGPCGRIFVDRPVGRRRRYCSRACARRMQARG